MAQLRNDHDQFRKRNAAIVVVGPEAPEAFKAYWEKHRLPFIGLPDPDHTVLKRYGQKVRLFKLGRMPAQVIVDTKGRVRYAHYGHAMADIPSNAELLGILDNLSEP
jgi:peroxiredoxin Q/BCP